MKVLPLSKAELYARARSPPEQERVLVDDYARGGRLHVDPTMMDWRHEASCRDVDPELFFPIGTTGPALAQIEAARAICGSCVVQGSCLEWALATGQDAGIWGGVTEEDRRTLRRERGLQRVAV